LHIRISIGEALQQSGNDIMGSIQLSFNAEDLSNKIHINVPGRALFLNFVAEIKVYFPVLAGQNLIRGFRLLKAMSKRGDSD
jgi:hypothetical protein